TSFICSFVTPPGLRIIGISCVQSITVDSTPTPVGPPSIIPAIFPFKSAHTWSAVVGLGFPDKLALGAAIGILQFPNKCCATGWSGIRTAIVESPAVTFAAHVPLLG